MLSASSSRQDRNAPSAAGAEVTGAAELSDVDVERSEVLKLFFSNLFQARLKIQARDVDFISNLRRGCEDLYLKIFSQCAKCCPSFTNLYAKYSIVLKKVKHRRRKENGEILNEINRQDDIIKDTMTDARRDSVRVRVKRFPS